MRLCFIVEDRYRNDGMPLAVARQLGEWGHHVDLLVPQASVVVLSELIVGGKYDAWVLKTVSEGPGLSLLEAASAWGVRTINDARSIRPTRDKAVAAALASRHRLPFPLTYFAATAELLDQVPSAHYPLVVKPVNGSSGRSVYLVKNPGELESVEGTMAGEGFVLAQQYVANPGVDIKVYNAGGELHATIQRSPLHPEVPVEPRRIPIARALADLVTEVGQLFGLDLYGVDVVEGPDGWVVVDVNDFPSFHFVPDAPGRVGRTILRLAREGRREGGPDPSNVVDLRALAPTAVGAPHAPDLAGAT